MACHRVRLVGYVVGAIAVLVCAGAAQTGDPEKLLSDAERLAWLRAWGRAESIHAEAGGSSPPEAISGTRCTRTSAESVRSFLDGQWRKSPSNWRSTSTMRSSNLTSACDCGVYREGRDGQGPRPSARRTIVARSDDDRRATR